MIVGIQGRPVRDPADVSSAVSRLKPGDSVRVTVRRGGDRRTVRVRLTRGPSGCPRAVSASSRLGRMRSEVLP